MFSIAPSTADLLDRARGLMGDHGEFLGWLTAGSLVFLVASALGLPWLVARLPADYFTVDGRERIRRERIERTKHPGLRLVLHGLRNVLGLVVFCCGVLMLVLPGQGILSMLVGLMLIDYPSKHEFERWLMAKPAVHRPLNWLRSRVHRPPFEVEEEPGEA